MAKANPVWDQIKGDDINALETLYHRYFNDLINLGKHMNHDTGIIEDAVQETFLNFWKYRKTITEPVFEKAYIIRAFKNQLVRLLQQQSSVVYNEDEYRFNFEVSFENKLIEGEESHIISQKLNKALKHLTNRQREIVYYRFFEGLPFDQIATIMGMQQRATYKLISRALATLKDILGTHVFRLLFLI